MGIFDLFRKKQNTQNKEADKSTEVAFDNLVDFIDLNCDNKIKELDTILKDLTLEYNDELNKLESNIIKLNNAEIKNKALQERIIQIAYGNRENYIKNLNSFVNENMVSSMSDVVDFCNKFEKSIENLNKTSVKSHNIMQEVFLNETNSILLNVRNLDKIVLNIKKKIDNFGLTKIPELKDKALNFQKIINNKRNIENEIKNKESKIKTENNKIKEYESLIKEKKEGAEFIKYLNLVNDKKSIDYLIGENKTRILNLFSNVESALKKYSRLSPEEKIVGYYLENSINSLLSDVNFEIINIADKIKDNIIRGSIEIKDNKKNKMLESLDKINKEAVKKLINEYHELNNKIEDLSSTIDNSGIDKEIKALENELGRKNEEIILMQKEINRKNKSLAEIEIDEIKNSLEKEINDILKEDVKIVL